MKNLPSKRGSRDSLARGHICESKFIPCANPSWEVDADRSRVQRSRIVLSQIGHCAPMIADLAAHSGRFRTELKDAQCSRARSANVQRIDINFGKRPMSCLRLG